MSGDKKSEKERRRREKEERKKREKEEKARLKAEKKELRERKKREKREALQELERLPEVEEGKGEEPAPFTPVEELGESGLSAGPETAPETLAAAGAGASAGKEIFSQAAAVEVETKDRGGEVVLEEKARADGEPEDKESWFSRLRRGLSRSRANLIGPLAKAMASRRFDDAFWEEVENIMVGADMGMEMTMLLVDRVKEVVARDKLREPEELMVAFRETVADLLDRGDRSLHYAPSGPSVFMVVGVNGTGKTTTIAKLAHLLRKEGKRVILAAGDTFRAAGIEQLETWGDRVGVHTVKHQQGSDAAAVVHDAVESALARGIDVVIADTAGRLHTKVNLMEELKKIKRVAERKAPVTETLLVIDATTGQNGLIQARQFKEAVEVTGVVLTKLDGTAKGGIVVAIAHELGIPIKFIGVGEKLDDLHPFDPREFAQALFS